MSGRFWTWWTWGAALAGFSACYGLIVRDALLTGHWIHVVTLTPLIPYLIAGGLAYAWQAHPGPSRTLALLTSALAAGGVAAFGVWFLGALRPVQKAVTILLVALVQSVILGGYGAALAVARSEPKS